MRHSKPRVAPLGVNVSVAMFVALTLALLLAATGCASRPDVRADDGIGAVIAQADTGSRRPLPKPAKPAKRRKAKTPRAATAPVETTSAGPSGSDIRTPGTDADPDLGVLAATDTPPARPPRARLPLPHYMGDEFYSPVLPPAEGERLRDQIVFEALAQIGRPYIYGGADSDGFDCSGLVKTVFARSGVRLPRTAQQQCEAGTPVDSLDDARPGDLLCFDTQNAGRVSHVVLYTGQNIGVHAPRTNRTIVAVPMNTGYWMDHLVGISRVLR